MITSPARGVIGLILTSFFALSGFLVSGSLERCRTLVSFIGLRVIRLVPALAVESVIAMALLGPMFTELPRHVYFRLPELYTYLGNLVGDIHYTLPGVFDHNPLPQIVNGQLWTLPFELYCYLTISLFILAGAYRNSRLMILGCVVAQLLCFRDNWHISDTDTRVMSGTLLVLCFLYGSFLYRFREAVQWNGRMALVTLVAAMLLLQTQRTAALSALPIAYFTVYAGLLSPPRSAAISSGDYSYGVFLYGFPIQQALVAAFPVCRHWLINMLVALPIICFVAYLSWHFVEKRALKLRPRLIRLEDWWMPSSQRIAQVRARVSDNLRARWAAGTR